MGFGAKLKTARLISGYTQQQVAEKMGIDKSTYCGYETEKRFPDIRKIRMLSRILNVSADELLELLPEESEENLMEGMQPSIRMLARAGKKMTPEQAEHIRKYAEFMFPEAFKND